MQKLMSVASTDTEKTSNASLCCSGVVSDTLHVLRYTRLRSVGGIESWLESVTIHSQLSTLLLSTGNTSPTRTYQDLLANPDDEAMLEHYATGQVAKLGIDGSIKLLGTPGIYMSLFISPDGKHLLVTRIQRPFSYLRTLRGFPKQIEVWSSGSSTGPTPRPEPDPRRWWRCHHARPQGSLFVED